MPIEFNAGKPFFHIPPIGLKIPMELHVENRKRLISALREKIKSCIKYSNTEFKKFIVLLQAGSDLNFAGSDSDSYFHWAFGTQEPDWLGAINLENGRTTLFVPENSENFLNFMGEVDSHSVICEKFCVDEVFFINQRGLNTDSGENTKPANFVGIENFNCEFDLLHPVISECRVLKSPLELEVMRYSNKASSSAHRALMRLFANPEKEPLYQYKAESLFQHHCYYNWGMRHVAYTCIAASGCHCAVLHYGHAGKPNDQPIRRGDMCLFDMGGEYHCYASDITCCYPAGGKFSTEQRVIYNAVLKANRAVIAALKPGVSWIEMHQVAEKIMLNDLIEARILKGNLEDMMTHRLGAIFQPHGLGHLLGCDVHDVGGYNEGCPERSDKPGLHSLRTARPMLAGMTLTVEPGCYFIDRLINKALQDSNLRVFIETSVLEKYKYVGGVRIEDNVVVTENGCEVLTDVPRTVDEIEKWMAGEPFGEHK